MNERPHRSAGNLLDERDLGDFLEQLSRVVQVGGGGGAGCRAAAAESDRPAVARVLRLLADRMERGETWPIALADPELGLPPHVTGLVTASIQTGHFAQTLRELIELEQTRRETGSRSRAVLAYPLFVSGTAVVWGVGFTLFALQTYEELFLSFSLQVPFATRYMLWWRDVGLATVGAGVLLAVLIGFVLRRTMRPVDQSRWLSACPFVGRLRHWRALADWAGLTSLLIRYEIPLPTALAWSARANPDPWVAECAAIWAGDAAQGESLANSLARTGDFPRSLRPLVMWGETQGRLADSLDSARELLEHRLHVRVETLRQVIPPLLFTGIGCGVITILLAVLLPIISLMDALN